MARGQYNPPYKTVPYLGDQYGEGVIIEVETNNKLPYWFKVKYPNKSVVKITYHESLDEIHHFQAMTTEPTHKKNQDQISLKIEEYDTMCNAIDTMRERIKELEAKVESYEKILD